MAEFQDIPGSTVYVVACSAITFLATLIAVAAHIIPVTATLFVGTVVEGVFTVLLLIFWSAIVALISDASIGLVGIEDATQTVQNANLYYFSWAGFVTCILLAVDYAKVAFGFDTVTAIRSAGARTELWSGMLGTSVVIFGSCIRTIRNDCNEFNYRAYPDGYCARTIWGITFGCFGVVFAMFILYFKVRGMGVSLNIEGGAALALSIMDTISVMLLTAANGPGSAIGNIYYFSWGSFMLSWYLLFACYGEWSGHQESADPTIPQDPNTLEQPNQSTFNNGDIEVETFDDGKI
jgi:hypothetical protein